MAQVTKIRLVDDLDGGHADESVDFTVDNNRYQMDLSEENAAEDVVAVVADGGRDAERLFGRRCSCSAIRTGRRPMCAPRWS